MSLNRTKDAFHVVCSISLLCIFWTFLMTTNTLFPHSKIMTTLDPIFSSLQRGSRQATTLCCDQPKQLIS